MTSFCMTSLHLDLNEAAKCVDIMPGFNVAHSYKIQNGDDIWPNLRRLIVEFMNVQGLNTLERTHDWCSAVGKVAF